ncbi:MAG: DNA polymerase III subunit gamma/tau [Rhizobiaceae bacterium]
MMDSPATGNKPYRVLARKYRPSDFGDLIGQEPMVRTLSNAFRTGRIAQAYMLTGVRGVGKTTTARILARALNYRREGIDQPTIDVAEEGEHCRAILEGRHVDVIEMDAASHTGIDDIRDLIESAQYAPAIARYKVYIIDEVHMLSRSAFNGLLKTLEEPPAHLKFVFATTEIRKVPITVLSRCQRFDLRRIDVAVMQAHLQKVLASEGVEAEDDALAMIARAAEGSVRDALSIMDQAIAHAAGRLEAADVRDMLGLSDRTRVVELFDRIMRGDIAAALEELRSQYELGADPLVVLSDLADLIHYVTRLKYVPAAAQNASFSQVERQRGEEFARDLSVSALSRAWQILIKGLPEVRESERPLTAADMVLVRLTHAASLPGPEELARSMGDGTRDGSPRPAQAANVPQAPPSGSPTSAAPRSAPQRGSLTPATGGTTMGALSQAPQMLNNANETDPQAEQLTLASFEALILLAEDKRDIQMRTWLRRHVRLVNFSDGRLEFNLAGDPPAGFVQNLSMRLQGWTGKRWMVTTSREGGQPTLEEQERQELGARTEIARADPAVEAIMGRFPGARIVDVRIREQEELPEAPGEDDTGLDEFLDPGD